MVTWGKYAILFGGRDDFRACNVVYRFDTTTHQWKKFENRFGIPVPNRKNVADVMGNVPNARDGHSACVIDDAMYIYGGFVESEHQFCGEVYRLHLKVRIRTCTLRRSDVNVALGSPWGV